MIVPDSWMSPRDHTPHWIVGAGLLVAIGLLAGSLFLGGGDPVPTVVATEQPTVDPDDALIAELRTLNADVLADNAELDRIIAEQDLLIDDLESERDDLRDAVAAVEDMVPFPAETAPPVAAAPRPVPPPPPPAPVGPQPLHCTSPHGTYTVCETQQGEYRCRDDVTPSCGPWWGSHGASAPAAPTGPTTVTVTRVIDGDTIVLTGGERVRLAIVDTPEEALFGEPAEPCAGLATATTTSWLDAHDWTVELRRPAGAPQRDAYDRLVAEVISGGDSLNVHLYGNAPGTGIDDRYTHEDPDLTARLRATTPAPNTCD